MAEGSAGASLMDSRQFIYLPHWVKLTVIAAAAVLLMISAFSVYESLVVEDHGDFIVFFLSVSQSSAVILIFFLIATFSRRDANVTQLQALTDEFLHKYISLFLQRVSIPSRGIKSFEITDEGERDIFGRLLQMRSGSFRFSLWVGLNVNRIFVIYFVPRYENITIDHLKKLFSYTFGGAENSGFAVNYEEAENRGEPVVSIWLTVEASDDLLSSPQDKMFWAQDIAMMTESFLRTALRNGLDLDLKTASPEPL